MKSEFAKDSMLKDVALIPLVNIPTLTATSQRVSRAVRSIPRSVTAVSATTARTPSSRCATFEPGVT